ncbi:hypothetical protein PUV54_03425 [Hyphococcus flavus]|uniref:Lipoprotein n=1 Tax=Hyphococcus flavus TaxID=1866326 RepID=A0AAE9ZCA3_9PROT|nr:hypothetical protein [Hyphococcus flavus]WDI32243.1 hypothetical protein PUV54_03425 [Hyphococcus flavus]
MTVQNSFPSLKLLLAASVLAISGCASTADYQALQASPGFAAGYGDGCSTATEEDKSFSIKRTRDAYAFDNDEGYRAGWRQGYLECAHQTPEAKDGGRILGERNEY